MSPHHSRSDGHEGFDAEWLALREPVDHRSRASDLTARLAEAWAGRGWSRIVDLGAGTGSNLRYLSPRLPGLQRWTLVERDPELARRSREAQPGPDVAAIEVIEADLADSGLGPVVDADVVTASALLDLVSEPWLRRLITTIRDAGAALLVALDYDGSIDWRDAHRPPTKSGDRTADPRDERIRVAVNVHQRRDKGLGPALGPEATEVAEVLLRDAGYETWRAPSAWRLGAAERDLALALIDGWESAAAEVHAEDAGWVREWALDRRRDVRTGPSRPVVGHEDLLAFPP